MNSKAYHYFQAIIHRINQYKSKILGEENKSFLKNLKGVIHIGANSGQEREVYNNFGLNVLWVEPIDDIFEQLTENIKNFPKQKALKALVADEKGKEFKFNIASNNGESSSIFNLKGHKDIWPSIDFEKSVIINSETLPSLIEGNNIDINDFNGLILDTQGSELLILKGAKDILKNFKFIKSEVADFEAYENCCTLPELNNFMLENGFNIFKKQKFALRQKGGAYYDMIYVNNN